MKQEKQKAQISFFENVMRYPEAYKPVKTAKHVDLLGKTITQRKHNRNFPSSVNILYISR
jgi:hypothetical protein